MSGISVQDRCRGVLLGLAAGDRNGGPIRMAMRLGESLLELARFDPQDIMARYLCWWREGAFDTGPVSERALELMAAGMSSQDASAQVHQEFAGKTAGCNPAHRASPLAMLPSLADDDLPDYAITEARLTHYDPLAGDAAAAVTVLCRSLNADFHGASSPHTLFIVGLLFSGSLRVECEVVLDCLPPWPFPPCRGRITVRRVLGHARGLFFAAPRRAAGALLLVPGGAAG